MKRMLYALFALTMAVTSAVAIAGCGNGNQTENNTGNENDGADKKYSEGLEYTLLKGGESYEVSGLGNCTDKNIVIPAEYEGKRVTKIGDSAFNGTFYACGDLTGITIPDGVTVIGEWAFNACEGLTEIDLPDSVTQIGDYAFANCTGLVDVNIPNGVTRIESFVFFKCSGLTDITIPDSVTVIAGSAFASCEGLTEISIPKGVADVAGTAFIGCSGLESISVSEDNPKYKSVNNCLLTKDGTTLVTGCKNSVIPDGVTHIGYSSFEGCSGLIEINVPNGVTVIENSAFQDCTELKVINYGGTKEQWEAINKWSNWDKSTGFYTVHCEGGVDIPKQDG